MLRRLEAQDSILKVEEAETLVVYLLYLPIRTQYRIFVLLSVNAVNCIDGQENKYSVLNECSRMLKYNVQEQFWD
jgi:hypothetical protein